MIETSQPDYPSFTEAETRFLEFVRAHGIHGQIIHVSNDDLVVLNGQWFARCIDADSARLRAREAYERAVCHGRGVSLTGHCLLDEAVCVHVYGPVDDDESERLMYPNGLKLSIGTHLPSLNVVGRVRWAVLRGRQLVNPAQNKRQIDLLK